MKTLIAVIIAGLGVLSTNAEDEAPAAQAIIDTYGMTYLERESGYLVLREGSEFTADVDGAVQSIHNSIYYLLTAKKPINYLHWLASEDIHILVDGGPLDYYLFLEDGTVKHVRLGLDRSKGEVPAVTVPARSYKAIKLVTGSKYGLMVNVLTPAWSKERVKIGVEPDFFSTYTNKASWATSEFLHSLQPID